MEPDINRSRRETIRWSILLTLNTSRPIGCHESVVHNVLGTLYPDATAMETRREMHYLEARHLIEIHRDPHGPWRAELTSAGIDIAEYTVDCGPGIARPAKYW